MRRTFVFLSLLLFLVGLISTASAQTAPPATDIPAEPDNTFRVTEVLPSDGATEIDGAALVTVIFNRPIVPLGSITEMDSYASPITLNPPVVGTGEWLNTSIYTFRPAVSWGGGNTITATVNAGLQALDGSILTDDYSWSFTTALPQVVSVSPENGEDGVVLNRRFQMTFNMPMDQASIEAAFYLNNQYGDSVPGAFAWNDTSDGFMFTPDAPLTIATTYTAGFPANTVHAVGSTATIPEFKWTVNTIPYPAVTGTYPSDGEINVDSFYGVTIYFASPMDQQSLEDRITIDPEPQYGVDYYLSSWDNSLQLSFPLDPSTIYTVSLDAGAEDLYGNRIDTPFSFHFTTAQASPSINLQVPGSVGFYSAYTPQTQLYMTHRNVSRVDLALYSVPLEDFGTQVLNEEYYDPTANFEPSADHRLSTWSIPSSAETDSYRYELIDFGANTPGSVHNGDALRPGVYFLTANSPETEDFNDWSLEHFLVVGTANLMLKTSVDSATVWATDIQSGAPLVGVPITVYSKGNIVLGTGITDTDGITRIDLPRASNLNEPRMAILNDGENFGISVNSWSNGIDPWSFGVDVDYYPRQYTVYLYTDRPIYRPDQPVYFRGVLRHKDDISYTRTDLDSVPVTITDDRGEVIYERNVPLNEFGTFSDTFQIAADAPLGYYQIEVELPSNQPYTYEGGSVYFNVAEYRLPEFQVEATAAEPAVAQGDTVRVQVDSTYFFGGNVSNASVSYNVIANPYFFSVDLPGNSYSFNDYNYDSGPSEYYGSSAGRIADGEGVTDEEGAFLIEFPADLEDATQSQIFSVEAVVSDESGQSVAGRTQVIVHQGEFYVGVRPQRYVSTADEEATLDFITVDWDGNAVPNKPINVAIVERRWSSVQEQDPDGRTIWSWEMEEIPVDSAQITTGADGTVSYAFTPPNGGVFKITATSTDDAGNEVRASTAIWVSSREYVSWRQQNSNRIDLIASATTFNVGDTAEILITSPFQGTTEALITVERGDVYSVKHVTMESNSYVFTYPISAEDAPNVVVSVFLVKGIDENNPIPAFRMGMTALSVDNSQKLITIEATRDVEVAGPGDTVTYTVRTTDYAGNPVQAEVGVGLTDLASLSIADPNSPNILDVFYGPQSLIVRTATALTMNTDQITQEILDTIKGGGGGLGEGGIFDIREEFVDTAYWQANLVTGVDGTATFSVTLPDNLTTWQLDARAVTRGDDGRLLVGQDTFDLLSTKPVLIRPVTPRFFTVGDRVTLVALVNNNTDQAQTVEVSIEASGVTFENGASQTVDIPAGGRVRVAWLATVADVESVDLTFYARTTDDRYTDASKPLLGQGEDNLLPVYRYEAPEITGTGGVIRSPDTLVEGISIPEGVTQGELIVNVEPSLAATTFSTIEVLRDHPRNHIEWTISLMLPNVMAYRAINAAGYADDALRQKIENQVQFALQRLVGQQRIDGGWGWSLRDESNALVTAYALIGLTAAQEAGFTVDPALIARTQTFVQNRLITIDMSTHQWRMDRQAIMLYALAYSGAPDVARTTNLYDQRERLSLYANAFVARSLNLINPTDERITTLVSDLINAAILSANGTHWEESDRDYWNWNTNTRTTAIVLGTLVQLRPDSDLIPGAVRWLMIARTADAWETTQETAWALMALSDFMQATGELNANYAWDVAVNGASVGMGVADSSTITESTRIEVEVAEMLVGQVNELTLTHGDGAGSLYYTAYLRNFLPVPEIEAANEGLIVQRRYTLIDDPNEEPITSARVGDVVQVRLTIIAPNDLHYVIIEDPIPAGVEPINPDLTSSQQVGTRPGLDSDNSLRYGWGWWWFSDIEFHDEKVVLSSTYLPAGTYEYIYTFRPGLEGVYNVIPTTGYETYFPEVYGRGDGETFTVFPAE